MIFKKKNKFLYSLYIFFYGVITSFSLPPYNYWFVNFLTFSLLFILILKNKNENSKTFFLFGYVFGFGYFLSNMYWIPLSLLYDDNFKILIPIAIILIPSFLSLFYAFAFLVFKLFLNSRGIFSNILLFSISLSFFEFIRGSILSGFPWNLFAYSFIENIKFIQITSVIGIYSFNTILITIFIIPSIIYLSKKKNDIVGFIIIILISLFVYIYGGIKVNKFKNLKVEKLPYELRVLSTNISIKRFYSNTDSEKVLKKLIDLSRSLETNNIIFIWPEGVMPQTNLVSLKNEYNYLINQSFLENHFIILGINDYEIKNGNQYFYNSLALINNEANSIFKYHKNKLVPFGEFLPLEKYLSKIGLKSLTNNYQSFSPGSERKTFSLVETNKIKFLPLICYEIIYSGKLSSDNDFNFIVNISEDGWFGNSVGPHQHFAHSILRSVEYGKYTLRSANNGISAIIDPTGATIDKIDIKNEGIISLKEIVNVDTTLFSTYGNKIYFLIILLYIFLIFSFKKLENE